MTGSPPKAPKYQPIPYTPPAPLQQANVNIPQALTPGQVMSQGAGVESMLPNWLQLTQYNQSGNPATPSQGGPFNQQLMQQMQNWYLQNQVMPQVSQAQSQMQQGGQNYGSYGPAMAGQMQAQGQQEAFQAALAANQQAYNDVLSGRQSYFGGGPATAQAQNLASIQQGEAVTNANLANAQMANQYDLGAAGMQNQFNLNQSPNAFNLQNYGNQLAAYQAKNQALSNAIFGGGMIGLGGLNTAGNLGWQPFGGNSGQSSGLGNYSGSGLGANSGSVFSPSDFAVMEGF